ncbi:uncharacterized protein HKW66_Vig0016730 [Vigna angularis]|uniref:Uncharacterized protein n=1 Tax=Phaseolus angularis TaxID=3914 RepID=A0A8T0LIQ1_PHAAN|nr:uncharacterized protein HKW66_Vig0016730 [Vigna angularis]
MCWLVVVVKEWGVRVCGYTDNYGTVVAKEVTAKWKLENKGRWMSSSSPLAMFKHHIYLMRIKKSIDSLEDNEISETSDSSEFASDMEAEADDILHKKE